MTKDEALKLALEALELHGKQYPHMVKGYCLDAITAIKEALAQPERTPYITMPPSTPMWTIPPQRKPLTDDQITLIIADCASSHQHTDIHFARAIEAAHGIKGEA
jgi:hypothetical protein